MGTVSYFSTVASAANSWDAQGTCFVLKNTVDFSKNNVLSGDIVQVLGIPAGVGVLAVYTRVVTAVGAACTCTVGDAVDADGWMTSTTCNLNATAGTYLASIVGTGAYCLASSGKFYTAADTIDFTMGNNATAGIVNVYALCYQLK